MTKNCIFYSFQQRRAKFHEKILLIAAKKVLTLKMKHFNEIKISGCLDCKKIINFSIFQRMTLKLDKMSKSHCETKIKKFPDVLNQGGVSHFTTKVKIFV